MFLDISRRVCLASPVVAFVRARGSPFVDPPRSVALLLRGASSARRRRVSLERARRRAPAGVADGEHDDRREREKRASDARDARATAKIAARAFVVRRAAEARPRLFVRTKERERASTAYRPQVSVRRSTSRYGAVILSAFRNHAFKEKRRAFRRRESCLFVRLRRQRGGEPPEDFRAPTRRARPPACLSRARSGTPRGATSRPRAGARPGASTRRWQGVDGEKARRKTHPTRLRERERRPPCVVPRSETRSGRSGSKWVNPFVVTHRKGGSSTAQYVLGPSSNSRLRTAATPSSSRAAFFFSAEPEGGLRARAHSEPRAEGGGSRPGSSAALVRVSDVRRGRGRRGRERALGSAARRANVALLFGRSVRYRERSRGRSRGRSRARAHRGRRRARGASRLV